jgi:hypothetical protein
MGGQIMAFIAALGLTALVIVGLYKAFTSRDARDKLIAEFVESPGEAIFVTLWCGSMLVAFWGVFIPVFGMIKITIFGHHLHVWSAAAIAAGVLSGFAALHAIIRSGSR